MSKDTVPVLVDFWLLSLATPFTDGLGIGSGVTNTDSPFVYF